jgi:transcriptional regulator with XRE-family HTH domain
MSTSRTITEFSNKPSRGDLAYVCARNQSQAHSLLVRAVRESGLSQKELANLTGIDEATISRTLSRPRNIELNTLSKLVFGACGAFLSFSMLRPKEAGFKGIYLAVKSISSGSSGDQLFFYSADAPIMNHFTSNSDPENMASIDSGNMNIREKARA